MRAIVAGIFLILIGVLNICAVKVRHSKRQIAGSVSLLLLMLIPPVAGNLIITLSTKRLLSLVGCYVFYFGMDLVIYALYLYTLDYCRITEEHPSVRYLIRISLIADALQLLANPIFHHAFGVEWVLVEGSSYYRMVPFAGQAVHRAVVYGVFAIVVWIFYRKLVTSPKINIERYAVILLAMVVTGALETYFIFSRQPIDLSMIGFGVFGILVFYFTMHYKPYRLLDQMLVNFVQEMPLSAFFFDNSGRCVWANNLGLWLKELIQEYGVSASRLRVEITETVMMQDNQKRLRILRELREAGFLVEMDDFGSGYSSLNLLKDMPIDLVKVDMQFLKEAECNKKAQTILRNIMQMTGDLGIPALTEGVETEEQFRMLLEMGCSLFQGYYFAKPMPLDQFEAFCFSDRGASPSPQPD